MRQRSARMPSRQQQTGALGTTEPPLGPQSGRYWGALAESWRGAVSIADNTAQTEAPLSISNRPVALRAQNRGGLRDRMVNSLIRIEFSGGRRPIASASPYPAPDADTVCLPNDASLVPRS